MGLLSKISSIYCDDLNLCLSNLSFVEAGSAGSAVLAGSAGFAGSAGLAGLAGSPGLAGLAGFGKAESGLIFIIADLSEYL